MQRKFNIDILLFWLIFTGQEGSVELAKLLLRLGQLDIAETTLKNVPLSDRVLILAKVNKITIYYSCN